MWKSQAVKDLEDRMALLNELSLTRQEDEYLEASEYYWGRQYRDKEPWDSDAPLYEKKPKRQIRLTKLAVDEVNGYLFGEDKAPTFRVEKSEDVEDDSDAEGDSEDLDPGAPDPVTQRIHELHKSSGLKELQAEIGRLGLLHDAVGVGFHKHSVDTGDGREAHYHAEILHGPGTTPTFGHERKAEAMRRGIPFGDLLEVDERWRTMETDAAGRETHYIHRRKWTPDRTVEYLPVKVGELSGAGDLEAAWTEDPDNTIEHELSFVPCEWIPNGVVAHDHRGKPLVGRAERELEDALNYTISQTERGIAYNQDPRTVFKNLAGLDFGPIKLGGNNTLEVHSASENLDGGVEVLELDGAGQKVAMEFSTLIKATFFQLCHVVLHNPDEWAGVASGTALERLLAPMLTLVKKLRPIYGSRLGRLLAKMYQADQGERPSVEASWGPLVEPTLEDRAQAIPPTLQALNAGVLLEETVVDDLSRFYAIDDVQAYMEKLAGEFTGGGTAEAAETEAEAAAGQQIADALGGA